MVIEIEYEEVIQRFVVTALILLLLVVSSLSETGRRNTVRQIKFQPGHTTAVVEGLLRPYANHIYRFRGRARQKIHVTLHPTSKKANEEGDIVFWVQSRRYIRGRSTLLLDGIDKGGVTDWSGELPVAGEYEIYISNPRISDHTVTVPLRYNLEVKIE
jgi:hypothetical protein